MKTFTKFEEISYNLINLQMFFKMQNMFININKSYRLRKMLIIEDIMKFSLKILKDFMKNLIT